MLFLLAVLFFLGAAVVAFVVYPIFARGGREATPPSAAAIEGRRLAEKKEQILSAIKDLDFEHAAGKLSQRDYLEVRADFLARAAEILTRQEELARAKPPAAAAAAVAPAPAEEVLRPHCVACGQQNPEGAKFCFRCGAKIETLAAAPAK